MDEYYRDEYQRKHMRRQTPRVDFERPAPSFSQRYPGMAKTKEQKILVSHWRRFGGIKS